MGLEWGRSDTYFADLGPLGSLYWRPMGMAILVSMVIVLIPLAYLGYVDISSGGGSVLAKYTLADCSGGWISICFPSILSVVIGLVIMALLTAALNYFIVKKFLFGPRPTERNTN